MEPCLAKISFFGEVGWFSAYDTTSGVPFLKTIMKFEAMVFQFIDFGGIWGWAMRASWTSLCMNTLAIFWPELNSQPIAHLVPSSIVWKRAILCSFSYHRTRGRFLTGRSVVTKVGWWIHAMGNACTNGKNMFIVNLTIEILNIFTSNNKTLLWHFGKLKYLEVSVLWVRIFSNMLLKEGFPNSWRAFWHHLSQATHGVPWFFRAISKTNWGWLSQKNGWFLDIGAEFAAGCVTHHCMIQWFLNQYWNWYRERSHIPSQPALLSRWFC